MDEKVKNFLEEAKAKEQEAILLEKQKEKEKRDALLISLGLTQPDKNSRKYNNAPIKPYDKYDPGKKMYYYETEEAIEVTDEEFEEIKKYAKYFKNDMASAEKMVSENAAESTLNTVNSLVLAIAIVMSIVLIIASIITKTYGLIAVGVGVFLTYLIVWAIVKVYINISNNLHQINSKIK